MSLWAGHGLQTPRDAVVIMHFAQGIVLVLVGVELVFSIATHMGYFLDL